MQRGESEVVVARGPYYWEHRPNGAGFAPREREILLLAAAGLDRDGIAERLACSPNTVHQHLSNLYARTDTHSTTHALAVAVVRGVITGNDLADVLKERSG